MKKLFMITLLLVNTSFGVFAQIPQEGTYQSADGYYSYSLKILDETTIEVVENNKTSVYHKNGNIYQHSESQYSRFKMRVASPTIIYAFQDGNPNETKYSWIGPEALSTEDCPLADKYQEMAEDESDPEVQAYTFCSVAALMKCTYTKEGFATYAAQTTMIMKQILVNPSKCPCPDVIPQSIWNAN